MALIIEIPWICLLGLSYSPDLSFLSPFSPHPLGGSGNQTWSDMEWSPLRHWIVHGQILSSIVHSTLEVHCSYTLMFFGILNHNVQRKYDVMQLLPCIYSRNRGRRCKTEGAWLVRLSHVALFKQAGIDDTMVTKLLKMYLYTRINKLPLKQWILLLWPKVGWNSRWKDRCCEFSTRRRYHTAIISLRNLSPPYLQSQNAFVHKTIYINVACVKATIYSYISFVYKLPLLFPLHCC